MKRIKGLDSIRFICALAVMFGHFGAPLPAILDGHNVHGLMKYGGVFVNFIFNGPAAVVIFFIISGFCINYPFRESTSINLAAYYTRRLLRICLPAVVAVVIYSFYHVDLAPPFYGVFWSIICEIIYYLLFPMLFYLNKYINWGYIVLMAYIISTTFSLMHLSEISSAGNSYLALGLSTWVIGLPCWLLGCWLSVNYGRFKTLSFKKIWMFRVLIILSFVALRIVKYHLHITIGSNCFTLNAVAFVDCAWLGCEIMYFQQNEPSSILERAGKWSYSLYIMHKATEGILIYYGFGDLIAKHNSLLIFASFVVAYIFYLVIENPSHKISVWASSIFSKSKTIAVQTANIK